MSEERDARQRDQKQGADPAEFPSPDALKTRILAHLGLLPESPAESQSSLAAWQQQVLAVQKLTALCTSTTVRQVVEALEQDLGQPHTAVRMAVMRALGRVYLSFPGHVRWELFMRGLADQAPEVRATTVQIFLTFLTAANPRTLHRQVVEQLTKRLSLLRPDGRAYEDESVNINIIQLIGQLGERAPDMAVAAVVSLACNTKEDWPVREAALLVLGSCYPRLSAEQGLRVSETLYDAHPCVRQVAIQVLQERVTVAAVLEVLQIDHPQRQVYAARVLSQWGQQHTLYKIACDQQATGSQRTATLLALAQLARAQDILIRPADLERLLSERDPALASVRTAAEMLKEAREIRRTQVGRDEEETEGTA